MLQAYVDGSGTGDPEFLVLAGFIAPSEVWAEFAVAWQERLDCARLSYFKMNEMRTKPEIAGWFYRLIEEYDVRAAIACVIKTRELREAHRSVKFPDWIKNLRLGENPYFWGLRNLIVMIAKNQEEINITEPVDFIFDDDAEKVYIPAAWDVLKKTIPPEIGRFMGDQPIYRPDYKTMPLQAADLFAWWALKWEREKRGNWAFDMPFPWPVKKKIPRLIYSFGRNSFLADISKQLEFAARSSGGNRLR